MGTLMMLKKICLLFLFISASLLSSSFAGRPLVNSNVGVDAAHDQEVSTEQLQHREATTTLIHERLLKVNTKDYGRYDPAPALVKPPFKLIPN